MAVIKQDRISADEMSEGLAAACALAQAGPDLHPRIAAENPGGRGAARGRDARFYRSGPRDRLGAPQRRSEWDGARLSHASPR